MTFSWNDHFKKLTRFFDEYQFLFNFVNTGVLTKNVLDKISDEWKLFYKNNNKRIIKDDAGPLQEFFKSIDALKVIPKMKIHENTGRFSFRNDLFFGLSDKKRHEVEEMSKVIHDKCVFSGIRVIVDLGSGLGYVSQLLHQKYGYRVYALESDENRIKSALRRQQNFFPRFRCRITYICHFVTEESAFLINNITSNRPFCIIGLHACADLTTSALKLFVNIKHCKKLIIMPCCYHKMDFEDSKFFNFPISKALNEVYKSNFIDVPFMRLGCQKSSSGWGVENEDGTRVFHLLSRALMDKYAAQEQCKLVKTRRRGVSKTKNRNFEDFLNEFVEAGFIMETISEPKQQRDFDKEAILKMWNELTEDDFMAAELLLMLQDSLQPVCEALILEDKVAYMEELGLSCNIVKIADERISPRCHAIIASRDWYIYEQVLTAPSL